MRAPQRRKSANFSNGQRSMHDAPRTLEPVNATREATEDDIRAAYHVRCKSNDGDRQKDVEAMRVIHSLKTERR